MDREQCRAWVASLIGAGKLADFYRSYPWKAVRAKVLRKYKGECQECKRRGWYVPADTVHHRQYIEKYPELALSETYAYMGAEYPNLWPVCHACHERLHQRRLAKNGNKRFPERW